MVGARRASIMVFDEAAGVLRTVAARGFGARRAGPGAGGRRVLGGGAGLPRAAGRGVRSVDTRTARRDDCGEPRGYRGQAFLSVPICYGAPGSPLRCVGVINLTDRLGGDRFTLSDRKLVTAVANQIGAAVENARLVERDLRAAAARPRAGAGARPAAQAAAVARGAAGRRGGRRALLPGGVGRRRLLHLHPAGPRPGGRHAGRRGLARLLGGAGDGAGDVRRRHPRGGVDHARRDAERAAREPVDRARPRPRCTSACSTACSTRSPAGSPTPTPATRTPSGCRGSGTPSGSRPPRRRSVWPRRAASSGARCRGRSITTCSCSGPTGWWTRGTRRASRSGSSGCSMRCAPAGPRRRRRSSARCWRRPRRSGRMPIDDRTLLDPPDLAVPRRQAPPRPAFPHRSPAARPHRRRARRRPGRHGARDRPRARRAHRRAGRSGPAGSWRSRRTADLVPALRAAVSRRPRSSRPTRSRSTGAALARPRFLVAGNIPYNITSPLIDKALEPPAARAHRVPGAEGSGGPGDGAARGSREYGALSVGVQAVARAERLFVVPAGAFQPRPKVDSAVLRLTPLGRAAGASRRSRRASGGWWSGCSASGGSRWRAGSAS